MRWVLWEGFPTPYFRLYAGAYRYQIFSFCGSIYFNFNLFDMDAFSNYAHLAKKFTKSITYIRS